MEKLTPNLTDNMEGFIQEKVGSAAEQRELSCNAKLHAAKGKCPLKQYESRQFHIVVLIG